MIILENILYPIVKHCNLNCKGCGTFSPISKQEFMDISVFEKDMYRMKTLFDNIKKIELHGGEPLLHPSIDKFIELTRKIFPQSKICILTNGLLLKSMDEFFWKTVKDNNIEIIVSFYPLTNDKNTLKKNFLSLRSLFNDKKVKYTIKIQKYFYKMFLLTNHNKPEEALKNCQEVMPNCTYLEKGRLYHCGIIANINSFNSHFKKDIPRDKGIDIHNLKITGKDILSILSKPTETCSYCHYKWTSYKWKNVKKDKHSVNDFILNNEEHQYIEKSENIHEKNITIYDHSKIK